MVPPEYRTINRAICLLPDSHQDEREAARAALHELLRQQIRLERAYDEEFGPRGTEGGFTPRRKNG